MADITPTPENAVAANGKPLIMHDGNGKAQILSIEALLAIRELYKQHTDGELSESLFYPTQHNN